MDRSDKDRINPETRADLPQILDDKPGHLSGRTTRTIAVPRRYAIFSLVGTFIMIGLALGFSKPLQHQFALSIVRQPTLYTQLYFTDPGKLSDRLRTDQKNIFYFSLVNNENRAFRYVYVVTLDDSASHLVVSRETVTIGRGSTLTRRVTVVPRQPKSKYLITITLEGLNQSIHFFARTSLSFHSAIYFCTIVAIDEVIC
jgi:hypothetical protein